MPLEIERKFLVRSDDWRGGAAAVQIRQGYLAASPTLSVRIRRAGARAFITGKGGQGLVRTAYENPIPPDEADEFEGALAGLIVAEIELGHAEQTIELPSWVGREVTDDPRYLNANLAKSGLPLDD